MNETESMIPPDAIQAPAWSLWAGLAGRGLVYAAIAFFVVALLLSFLKQTKLVDRVRNGSFVLGGVSLLVVFGCLLSLFVTNQFHFDYVWQHGDKSTSLAYKVAGIWTAQEGSFLLWACLSALVGMLALRGTGPYVRAYTAVLSSFLGTVASILAYETPFKIIPQVQIHSKTFAVPDGNGMTPSLQNYWVVIHPPTIFLGFGALAILFAYSVAAMVHGDVKDWLSRVRPWALGTLGVLGLGISMGGLWAYETQGWGGYWAWDPVENVSLVPWIFLVAFTHGIYVQTSRGKGAASTLFLGALPFLSFAYGTYLTRSGALENVSVHSFATMNANARGVLLGYVALAFAGFLGLFLTRGSKLVRALPASQPPEKGPNRESLIRSGMLIVTFLGGIIALGMSWPVIVALRGGQTKRVEEWLYHQVVVWFFIPLMILMAIAPFASWRSMEPRQFANRLYGVVCVSLGLTGAVQILLMNGTIGVQPDPAATLALPFGLKLGLKWGMLGLLALVNLVMVANVWRSAELFKQSKLGTAGFVSHFGFAVLMGGLLLSRGFERSEQAFVREGSPATALGYQIEFVKRTVTDPFDREGKVQFKVTPPSGPSFIAQPAHYLFGTEKVQDMVWPHIERQPSHDLYLAMAAPQTRAWKEPVTFKVGETKVVDGVTVTYVKPVVSGPLGQAGATFGASLELTYPDANNVPRRYQAEPNVVLQTDGLVPSLPQVGGDYRIAMVGGMNAADKSVNLMLFFSPPIYPLKVFYKPMTALVWAGTGILTVGGLMAALGRRRVTAKKPVVKKQKAADAPPQDDATVPAT